ncbi:MAG: hypothetical protein ACQKBY_10075 [Verrucomicrobiales bacterium]
MTDFTVELSFRPNGTSLNAGYQTFVEIDGLSNDAVQPFRLMRFGRTDANPDGVGFAVDDGDLILEVRTTDGVTWDSTALNLIDVSTFNEDEWYHLSIVADSAAGTLSAYRYNEGTMAYDLLGTATGYTGDTVGGRNWTIGRGAFNNGANDWVADANFDEFRLSDNALAVSDLLYSIPEPNTLLLGLFALTTLARRQRI